MKKIEQDIIIAINATRRVLDIFLGPFLTTYFIKTSSESIIDLSLYHIFAYCFFMRYKLYNNFSY